MSGRLFVVRLPDDTLAGIKTTDERSEREGASLEALGVKVLELSLHKEGPRHRYYIPIYESLDDYLKGVAA